jgi:hypothetical protein
MEEIVTAAARKCQEESASDREEAQMARIKRHIDRVQRTEVWNAQAVVPSFDWGCTLHTHVHTHRDRQIHCPYACTHIYTHAHMFIDYLHVSAHLLVNRHIHASVHT